MTYDEDEIRKAISIMKNQNDLFEVRIVASSKKNISGYFRDAETCINALRAAHINDNCNVYITLNGIRDECYSRQQRDRFMNNVTPTTTDSDIDLYTWFLIDIDPVRAAGTSSSEEQIVLAKKKSNEVYLFMKQTGFEEPIVGFSGNGVHLLYSVGLAVNEENKKLVKDCLAVLSLFFSDDKVSVDTANFNPARVCKLYGTLAQKGANTQERPHRMSYIVQAPEKAKQNDKALLQKLAGYLPVPDKPQGYNRFNPREFDLDQWLDGHGLHYTKASYGSGTKYILEHCPFDENHTGKDACIFKMSNGAIGFHCFHNSCADKTWQDVRRLYEPDAYDRQYVREERRPNYQNPNYVVEKKTEVRMVDGQPVFLTTEQIRLMEEPPEEFIKTGVDVIDQKMRGLKKGFVTCLSGLRAAGKSSIISQLTIEAVQQGYRTALFSGELKPKNLLKWLTLQAAGKAYVKETQYDNYYVVPEPYGEVISKWMDGKVYVYNNYYGNEFSSIMDQIRKCVVEHKVDLVILDNMMALNLMEMGSDRYQQQSHFVECLENFAKAANVHILFVAHPRKSVGFLRLDDVSGSNDIVNRVDNAFILHRVNNDFKRLTKDMFKWKDDNPLYQSTNVIEICKDRDGGVQDEFIPLFFEDSTKRLRNSPGENKIYPWKEEMARLFENDKGEFKAVPLEEELPFD
ncbi:AAA family ATPase [Lachnoclostridium pacaense]|uniref:DnaB-like helicase C-terminal domain-containing protein n=1 Tax=Enterocloster hominis (ex Hitch et al. 2024) TaxID=1917870 RepID=UPI001D10A0FB|nr:DnaB-like helicase C-terminal domain-containing protein [Lachnoclostridium pacaense]MCC2820663.1 AAA family ATPase [Lachnoclostridium pacaense]